MGLINPQPRFGFDTATGLIFDYVTGRDHALTDAYVTRDGTWNLNQVKQLILAGKPIEAALVSKVALAPTAPVVPIKAAATPLPGAPTASGSRQSTAGAPGHVVGLSVEQLQALKLLPLQAAAMGLTRAQLTVTGVTAEQVQGWALSAARADALKLTAEQRAALGVA